MSSSANQIRSMIYEQLAPEERYQLALDILQDFAPAHQEHVVLSEETKAEYQRRRADVQQGKMNARPWREVIEDLRQSEEDQ